MLPDIWVDADGCPVVEVAIQVARKYDLSVHVVKNQAVQIESEYAHIVTVDISRDAADFYIVNHMKASDVVVTQDYGLAAMVLSKKGHPINQNGRWINNDNIDMILEQRHASRVARQQKRGYTKHKKRSPEMNDHFRESLEAYLKQQLD